MTSHPTPFNAKTRRPAELFAGVENLAFDQRYFNPSQDDIEQICRFFSIGKLRSFKKEHGITIAHSNFFVFAVTTRGQYALKFYPADAARPIAIEYAVNRFLVNRRFPTPVMHAGRNGRPLIPSNGCLATCFSYVKGRQPWQEIKQRDTIVRLNAAMLSLKDILSSAKGRIPFLKQEDLMTAVAALNQVSRNAAPYEHKELIRSSLLDTCRIFQDHQALFNRLHLHNDTTLTNFLIDKKNVYILDLFHVREDYVLSDLANLVISCVFLKIPVAATRTVVKDYLLQHKIGTEYLPVLNTLVKLGLIRDYLKSVQREQSARPSTCPPDMVSAYLFHLRARKNAISGLLRKMNDPSTFIV